MKSFVTASTGIILLAVLATTVKAVNIETVPVGNPGNADRTIGSHWSYGGVDYIYNIGTYEVTAGQYTEFLNAVAATDPYELYNSRMDTIPHGCQITRHGSSGSYTYDFSGGTVEAPGSTAADWANRPVNYVSWGDATRFVNWLHNGQPTGTLTSNPVLDAGLTEDGAYSLNGAMSTTDLLAINREADWQWALPTADEWHKAAYHDKNSGLAAAYFNYPTSSNTAPSNNLINPDPGNNATTDDWVNDDYTIGNPYWRTEVGAHENSESPYGTFDQGGNVFEWNETAAGSTRLIQGGSYMSRIESLSFHNSNSGHDPADARAKYGFRVVQVSEPSSAFVSIDIKPGSDTNSINLGSNGNIPVAIFGTDTFDVTTVDLTTILLADAGVLERGKKGDLMASFEDINLDGLLDLLIHIDTQSLVLSDGDVEALLTGETFDGLSISGTDAINLVGQSGGLSIEDAPLSALSGVPEPGTITLLLCGLVSLICWRRRK